MEFTNQVSLQSEYEPATKHFLLIGFLAMLCGAVVFAVYCFKKKEKMFQENMIFLATAVSTLLYYLMWSGLGVMHKEDTEGHQRLVFTARYIDRFITGPLLLFSLATLCNADVAEIVQLIGVDLFMVASSGIGASVLHPWKWIWWTIGVVFFIMLAIQVFALVTKEKEGKIGSQLNILALLLLISWALKVGFVVLADIVSKIAYGLYLIFATLPQEEEGEGAEGTTMV